MKYYVELPIAGYITVNCIEAGSEEEAIENAFQEADWDIRFNGKNTELTELEAFHKIVEGNVCYASLHEACAEEDNYEYED